MTKNTHRLFSAAVLLSAALTGAAASAASVYDQTVLNDGPVMFLGMNGAASGAETDLSGRGHRGVYQGGAPGTATLPNGEKAASFNGSSQYLTVPAAADLSVPTAKALTIESWIKPATLQFAHTEAEGYVYFLGKGNPSQGYEYANRMYSKSNTANRPNRISDYDWNTSGGLGSGAYFQDAVTTSEWIMVADVINMNTGYIDIYKNGVLRGHVPLSQYSVHPGTTQAPFNVGMRNGGSWFQGAIGKVAVFGKALSASQIAAHYKAMSSVAPPPVTDPTPPAAAISAVKASGITTTGATFTWNTTTNSHSQVEYGPTASYGSLSYQSKAAGTSHTLAVDGLKAGTAYHYRVKSLDDATGQTAVSGDYSFTTTGAPAPAAPAITGVAATPTSSGVTIAWTTDKASHSQVEYGATSAYGTLSYQSAATGTQHTLALSGLTAGTAYHYRVKSLDDASKLTGVSADLTFTTTGSAPAAAVVSNVQTTGLTSTGVTFTWNTTTNSHSQVEYGVTSAYGTLSYQSAATGTVHQLAVSGLKSGTTYHYRVKSLNSATGKTDVSGDLTFKTPGTA